MKNNILSKIKVSIVFAIIGMLMITSASIAAEFTATATQKMTNKQMGNMNISGKIFAKGIIQRQELNTPMGKQIIINRPDKGLAWLIIPSTKSYMEMKIPKVDMKKKPTLESLVKKMPNAKSLGTEKISGYVCNKYKFNDTKSGSTGTVWISAKLQQELKSTIQSPRGSMSMIISNIKEAKQPDSLFTIPKGYKKQEMPPMPGMGGGMPSGGMPGMPRK